MYSRLKLALAVLLMGSFGCAWANVPVDSFNSANTALNPSIAVKRDAAADSSQGPADALGRFARRKSKSTPPAATEPTPLPAPQSQ